MDDTMLMILGLAMIYSFGYNIVMTFKKTYAERDTLWKITTWFWIVALILLVLWNMT